MPFEVLQRHLPTEIRRFRYPDPPVTLTDNAVVIDAVVRDPDPTYCSLYLFRHRWLQVFVTFDKHMNLKPDAKDPFGFALNCDITTPHYLSGNALYTTDLFLDVCVKPDGKSFRVDDAKELAGAAGKGWIGKQWFQEAQRECDNLIETIQRGGMMDLLQSVLPLPGRWLERGEPSLELSAPDPGCAFHDHPDYPRFR